VKDYQDQQFLKVLELKEKLEKDKILLYSSFDTSESFRKKLDHHLRRWISEKASDLNQPESAEDAPTLLHVPDLYRRWLVDRCQYMDLNNLIIKERVITVRLPEIFIPLYTSHLDKKQILAGEPVGQHLKQEKQEQVNIEDLTAKNEYLLVEGQAGSGKTTLLKHMAISIIQRSFGREMDNYLPVLIYLKDLPPLAGVTGVTQAEKLLNEYFQQTGNGLDIDMVKAFCQEGRAIFLLDGLDEITPTNREKVVNSLADFRIKYDKCKMIWSGRPHGIDDRVKNRFSDKHIRINTLNQRQVDEFIQKWFEFIYDTESALGAKTAQSMIGEIKAHPKVEQLIDTPLMLTAICALYFDDRKLPEQRAELYDRFINNLIYRRFDVPQKTIGFFMELAYEAQIKKRKKTFDKSLAVGVLSNTYKLEETETASQYRQSLEERFTKIEQQSGLLKSNSGGFEFWHLTFQEFLAARFIVDNKTDYNSEIESYWDNDWYKEVVELFIGFLSIQNKGWANKIVGDQLEKPDKSPFKHWRLASQSLLDIHIDNRDTKVVELAQKRLQEIFEKDKNQKIKTDTGEILGWLEDPRDFEEFVPIAGGEYDLEGLGKQAIQDFEIGKYPVTNRWYGQFIVDGGYKNEVFWSDEGKKWLKHTKTAHPEFWHNRKWKCPNAPVVGVCWYEADAFCRWLTLNKKDDNEYRLPTEEEWQAAAAGKGKKDYPWGAWQDNRCNTYETKIEKTSAVGIFTEGNTPEGVADLSGNVWEWNLSEYKQKKRRDDFAFDREVQELYDEEKYGDAYDLYEKRHATFPVLRGGSWNGVHGLARCSYRYSSYPDFRYVFIGFRLARTKKG
jgi:formylglycine-generating enzyme required for sulfatase activity/energy-coupling factor transporter ATP-binding protein EcfA2